MNTDYKLHIYESKYIDIKIFDHPFRHVIIDNTFNDEIYSGLIKKFPEFIARTKPYKDQPDATSDYEGYISGLNDKDLTNGFEFFSSRDLQNFVEKTFDIKTTKYISPSAHFHKAPSKSGFIHRDMNICSFQDGPGEFITTGGVSYSDDSNAHPNSVKVIRSVALLYYLNNHDNIGIEGGGTGLYSSYNNGELLKVIEPKNNRLFIFPMGHNSFHAYIGANFDRSAIVSWFHSSPAYFINRTWRHYRKNPKGFLERWRQREDHEYWKIENDPEYSKYFNQPLEKLL